MVLAVFILFILLEVLGTDIARLFAASCNYTNDFNVGSLQLSKVHRSL